MDGSGEPVSEIPVVPGTAAPLVDNSGTIRLFFHRMCTSGDTGTAERDGNERQELSTSWGETGERWMPVARGNSGDGESHGTWLRLDPAGEVGDLVVQAAPFGHQLPDLPVGVHHGGVIAAAEGLADLGQ